MIAADPSVPPHRGPQIQGPAWESTPLHDRYSRPLLAPNGQPWPVTSRYLGGDGNVSTGGLSSLTVDNGQNSSDMLVKLFDRRFERPMAVRIFFLRAYEQFKLEDITAGAYDIRHRNLDSGIIFKSQPFNLDEIEEPDGTRQYTVMTLTLYVVVNGNTRSETIGPEEF